MKKLLQLNVTFNQPELLEKMVEQLAYRHNNRSNKQVVTGDWCMMETSTTETFAAGVLSISEDDADNIQDAFITPFLFTCSKDGNNEFHVSWSMSLN